MRAARYLLIAALCAAALSAQLINGLNGDVSWLLTVGERMLAGQQLYVDIYELNPPMSALLYLPFVWLAHALGLSPEVTVVAAIIALALASCWLSTRILHKAGLIQTLDQWWLISCGALLLLPGDSFGEREHIAVILMLPILAVAALRSLGKAPPHAVVAGLAAGLAMAIKPHFALPLLLVAIYGAWHTRSWRPIFTLEHVIAGSVLMFYWLVVWFGFPHFFATMLPISAATYLGDRLPVLKLLFGTQTLLAWVMLFAGLLLMRKQPLSTPSPQYLAAAFGFFVVYLVQGKGFTYHLLPVVLLASIAVVWCVWQRLGAQSHTALSSLLVLAIAVAPGVPTLWGSPERREMITLLSPRGPGLKIANLSPYLDMASPLHRDLGGTLINSAPCLWITLGSREILRGTANPQLEQQMLALEQQERAVLRHDLQTNPPDIILVGTGFDWLGWAGADPAIAELLTQYAPLPGAPQLDRLQVFGRVAPAKG